ncbi:MAG: glycosyltransferase [Hormoscilla sp. GM7CHS1pb]|nr:glycosyltransferase [Hormoscilla sp. GM7CHS1pb]
MKIAIATLGSRGDVQPFVAHRSGKIGVGLQKAGHEVSICTSYSFKGSIVNYGLRYAVKSAKASSSFMLPVFTPTLGSLGADRSESVDGTSAKKSSNSSTVSA